MADEAGSPGEGRWRGARTELWLSLALIVATIEVYWPVSLHGFLNFDSPDYVTRNFHVLGGLVASEVQWAFTTLFFANWSPLTWLSHMLDVELFGLWAGGHHITSVVLHCANSLLLFFVLRLMTGTIWRSAFVAALFAIHPLHVESVAWVAARKDVLSAFFALLVIGTHTLWTRRPSRGLFVLTHVFFALGLMAKPMLVTLPCLLLLLDYWPLQRLEVRNFLVRVREKGLLFGLSMGSCILTLLAQSRSEAIANLSDVSIGLRIGNALIAYAGYLGKTVWPQSLSIFYPLPDAWPLSQIALAALVVLGLTALAFRMAPFRRYPLVGWLWFVGTLVPVVGLVQVGNQAMADRYTYIPLIGIFIVAAWGSEDLARRISRGTRWVPVFATASLMALATVTSLQLAHWESSEKMFRHTLAVARDSPLARNNLGSALLETGDLEGAIVQFERAVALDPQNSRALANLGTAHLRSGRPTRALPYYRSAIRAKSDNDIALRGLGAALGALKRNEEAMAAVRRALDLRPDRPAAWALMGKLANASGDPQAAIGYLESALRIDPTSLRTRRDLYSIYRDQGRVNRAVEQLGQILQLAPADFFALSQLAWIHATSADSAHRDGFRALELARRACAGFADPSVICLDITAAALAEIRRFPEAIELTQRAISIGDQKRADELAMRLHVYESGQAYREH